MDKPRLRLVKDDGVAEAIEVVDVEPETRAALSRLAGVAAASAASVLAQMVRAPVPAAEFDVRILAANSASNLPLLQQAATVRAHRTVRGDITGDLFMGQSEETASWLGSSLSSLGDSDPDWARQRLSDLAGISLAAFGLSLGRSVDMRLEPELSKEDEVLGVDGALLRILGERRLALVMQSTSPEQRSIGDFFLFASEEEVTALVLAVQ